MFQICLLIALAVSVTADFGVLQAPRLICYHSNWAFRRAAPMDFTPDQIDPNMCTHLVYSFARLNPMTFHLEPYESTDVKGPNYYQVFNDLKLQNTALKTLLAVGGWAQASDGFSAMVQTSANRKVFIDNSISYLRMYGFDGLDVNWLYPTQRGGQAGDKAGYASLATELRSAYQAEADNTGNERLLVSMALPSDEATIDDGYDIMTIGRHVDFGNLMSYDLHGSWEWEKHHHASLHSAGGDDTRDVKQTVTEAVSKWLNGGFPSQKLNLGLALYGRTWKTGSSCDINSAGEGAADGGDYSAEPGILAYYEICDKLSSGMTYVRDDDRKVGYACDANEWVGYDNAYSLNEKIAYLISTGLSGGSVWALDFDDFTDTHCGAGPWPLMTVIKKGILESGYIVPTPVPTNPPTVPPAEFCLDKPDGLYPNPIDCNLFFQCSGGVNYPGDCGTLAFNPICSCCDHPSNVPLCNDFP